MSGEADEPVDEPVDQTAEQGAVQPPAAPEQPSVLRSSSAMAAGTIASRVTGMVRNTVLIAAIGTGVFADTYSVANSLPNILYILLVGGALNAVFVPQLVRHQESDPDAGVGYGQRLLTATGVVLLGISVVAVLAAPWIVRAYATSRWTPTDFDVATTFARYCLPQIFFYGLYTMVGQVLNARGRFGSVMFAPVVNNVVVIVAAVAFLAVVAGPPTTGTVTPGEIRLLGLGTTLGVAAQALVLLPVLARTGFPLRVRRDLRGAGLGHAFALAKWTIGLVALNQLAFLVVTRLATAAATEPGASRLGDAGFTVYTTAYLVFVLPHSVITVSLVTALLPRLSKLAHAGRLPAVAHRTTWAARTVLALLVPAALLLFAFGERIGLVLFGYGNAGVAGGRALGITLEAFALGLPAFSVYYVLLRGFYALEDTRTPFVNAGLLNALNVLLALAAVAVAPPGWDVPALAAAYALTYTITTLVLWRRLSRRLGGLGTRLTVRTMVRATVAGLVSVGLGWLVAEPLARTMAVTPLSAAVQLAVGGGVAVTGYLLLASRMRISEVDGVVGPALGAVRRRLPGRRA